mgnify:CR=1 FL=1
MTADMTAARSIVHRVPALRWLVPAAAAALIIGGGAAIGTVTASATDAGTAVLPARSAAQLVADVHSSAVTGLSGTVVQTSDLGLPNLPSLGTAPLLGGMGSSDLTSMLAGTHTLRLWYAGPQRIRVALLGSLGESDIIRSGRDLWIWSSTSNTATHATVPQHLDAAVNGPSAGVPLGTAIPTSPQQAAAAVLRTLTPSTIISTDPGVRVAGRLAYQLVLRPKDDRSLVSSVRIAIDSAEHVPLRVQVYATGQQDPAFSVGFSTVDFSRPDAAEFTFNPPPGATVNRAGEGGAIGGRPSDGARGAGTSTGRSGTPGGAGPGTGTPPGATSIVGTGWSAVLVTSARRGLSAIVPGGGAGPGSGHAAGGQGLGAVLAALPRVSGSWGSGRLLRTALFSAVITDHGRMAVGAVPPDLLYAALGSR